MSANPINLPYFYETCIVCGVVFGSPVLAQRKRDGDTFYCPNGHGQSYCQTEEQKLRKELESTKNVLAEAERQREEARRERDELKLKTEKLNRRLSNGVCPCCHRTVKQLQRHIAAKHPNFGKPLEKMK